MGFLLLLLAGPALDAADVPSGQDSAEGVACDLATAFISADRSLFNRIVLPSDKAECQDFLSGVASRMDEERGKEAGARSGLREVGICFRMGTLSRNGPNP